MIHSSIVLFSFSNHELILFTICDEQVIIVWNSNRALPRVWPDISVPLSVRQTTSSSVSQRFFVEDIDTDAVRKFPYPNYFLL
jgi:hypothetical protein